MNLLYGINYAILSVFLTFFILEVGLAILSLVSYGEYRERFRSYLLPIWEVVGTFAVFYVVNLEVTYPTLLPFIGSAYILPLLIGAAFFIFRGSFLIYSEFIGDMKQEGLFVKAYAASTLVVAFLVISVLDSGVSGAGVGSGSVDVASMLLSPYNLLMFLSIGLISLFIVSNVFDVEKLKRLSILYAVVGFALVIAALYLYVPSVFANVASQPYLVIVSIAVLIVAIALKLKGYRHANYLLVFWLLLTINLFGVIQYPYFSGGQDMLAYLTTSAFSGPILVITTIGGAFVAAALSYLIYLSYIKAEKKY